MINRSISVLLLTLVVACGGGGDAVIDLDECGPSHPCAPGFTCTNDGHCLQLGGGSPDAAPDTSVPDAPPDTPAPDAAPDATPATTPDAPAADAGTVVDTTLLTFPPPQVASATASFTFSGVGALSFLCKLDDLPATPCTSPFERTVSEGPHTFSVAAVGAAGADLTPAAFAWNVDLTPPDTTITGPTGLVTTTDATFLLASNENATFQCALDGEVFDCASPAHFSGVAPGEHHFAARAIDAAGNIDPSPAQALWTVDVTGPIIVVEGTPADETVTSNPVGHFTLRFLDANDAVGGTFQCAIDGGAPAACTSVNDVTFVGDGPHIFGARGRDAAGNLGALVHRSFTLDRAAPAVRIDGNPTEGALTSQRTLALLPRFVDATEASRGSTLVCKLDGAAFTADACTTGAAAVIGADGAHTFTVKGRDLAGNEAQATRSWTLDTTAPMATLVGPPLDGSITTSRTTSFTWSLDAGAGPGAVAECKVVGTGIAEVFAAANCRNRTGLADGAYQFSVHGRDAAGNAGAAAAIVWEVDTQGPAVVFRASSTPADGASTRSPNVAYAWTFADPADAPGSHLELSLDGVTWTPSADGTFAGAFSGDGTHAFSARGVDAQGTAGPPIVRTMILDTHAPIVVVGGTPANNGFINAATAFTLAFNPAEPSGVFECAIDDAPTFAPANCANRLHADGAHSFSARGRDAAGNVGTPVRVAFTVDTVTPIATIDSAAPADGSTSGSNIWAIQFHVSESEVFVNIECVLDGQSFDCNPRFVPVSGPGLHTFKFRPIDFAGNVGEFTNQISYTFDNAPPVLNITTRPFTHDRGPRQFTITWTANEPATYTCRFNGTAVLCPNGTFTGMEGFSSMTFDITATDAFANFSITPITWIVN
jgi:hypothetical protein